MDKQVFWDCSTCAKWQECSATRPLCGRIQFNDHPSAKHPGPHGQPVVATAVARVEFEDDNGYLQAWHDDKGEDASMTWVWSDGGWERRTSNGFVDENAWEFCPICGLRLPTDSELPAMYDHWKKEQEGKG